MNINISAIIILLLKDNIVENNKNKEICKWLLQSIQLMLVWTF